MAFTAFPSNASRMTTKDGVSYAYALFPPATPSRLTYLLLHGFPSCSYDWRHVIAGLVASGYGVIAPDLLGYGDSDKPEHFREYSLRRTSNHIVQLLEHTRCNRIAAIGHDWGSMFLSRLLNWYPDRFSAAVFLAVGYNPPGPAVDFRIVNELMLKRYGYATVGYWEVLCDPHSAKLLESNHASFDSLVFAADHSLWKQWMGPESALQQWLTEDRTAEYASWLTVDEITMHKNILKKGGYTGPTNWYKAAASGVNVADDSQVPEANKILHMPVLLVATSFDAVSPPYPVISRTQTAASDLCVVTLPSGHWVQLEMPEQLLQVIRDWTVRNMEQKQKL